TPTTTLPPTLDFDSISEYIIPKPALCNRLVTLSTPHYQILSHPVSITNAKYERNALLFNLGFVFEKNAPTRVYEQIVRKLARILMGAEVQFGFLRNEVTKKEALGNIIEQIYDDLNSYAECQIPLNESNMINLKLFPAYPNPPPVHDYQVPVLIVNLERMMDKHWDMTIQRVIPRINGIHSVKRISENADVDCGLVRIAVQHLLYYGCVKMVDIFQFSNIYGIRPTLTHLLRSPTLQSELSTFVTRPGKPAPAFALLFSLYCALKPGTTVGEWMEDNNVGGLNVDVRRFFMYGVIKEFVYRIHKYPF
ncbi:nitrogen permease regulator 2-domain-containing protein, partial [Fimicolochytrium jonesii]|uniref:nitrogen permease regulator 2-domain-containing protein n=1 Tax=Fimicolochytrium jonesii TaxID=1396493 RepID=UPI0022FE7E4C